MVLAEYPYDNYYIYKVFHKKEKRNYAILVNKNNFKNRTTISYARYLMSIFQKRILDKKETVDHINEIKIDDRIENLQILPIEENKKKYILQAKLTTKMVKLLCPQCGKIFEKKKKNCYLTKTGGVFTSCSRKCAGKLRQRLQSGEKIDFSNNFIEIFDKVTLQ